MRVSSDTRSRILHVARFSAVFICVITLIFGAVTAIAFAGMGTSPANAAMIFIQAPLITVTVLAGGTLTLFLLTVSAPPTTRWGFAWRGAVAASVTVVLVPLMILLTAEWIPGKPGAAGGFILVVSAVVSFTLMGGPVWAGLLAVLLRRTLGAPGQDAAVQLSKSASRGARRRLGIVLCATGAFVALGITFLSFVPAMYKGADYKCSVEGPRSPLAEVSERSGIVTGSFSLWPLGRECTWLRADGNGTVAVNSGNWVGTGFAASAALISLAGAGLVVTSRRVRPQPPGT